MGVETVSFWPLLSVYLLTYYLDGKHMASKDIHALIPGNSEYVTLHGKRHLSDIIKVMGYNYGD